MSHTPSLPRHTSEPLIEHGLKLIAQAAVEGPEAAERACQAMARWRRTSPAHEAAALEAERRWDLLGCIAADVRDRVDGAPSMPSRRRSLRGLAALAGSAVLAGSAGGWYWRQPVFEQRHATGTAQLRTLTLPDMAGAPDTPGTRIDLDARTRVLLRLYRHQRVVVLDEGEARFEVARDADRRTAFTVKDRGGPLSVHVEHGHVRFEAHGQAGAPPATALDLRAGQALTLRPGQAPRLRSGLDARLASAWRDGWLVFDNTPLEEALPAILPVQVQPQPDGRVVLRSDRF